MKRKLLIGLGGLTSIVTPIAALSCACSSKSNETTDTTKKTETIDTTKTPDTTDTTKTPDTTDTTKTTEKIETTKVVENKLNFKSDVFEIVENKALFDITKYSDHEGAREFSKRQSSSKGFITFYIDVRERFSKEIEALNNWMLFYNQRDEYIKFGTNVFASEVTKFEGFKAKVSETEWDKNNINFFSINILFELLVSKNKQIDSNFKFTTDIDEFNDPNW